MNPSFPSLPLDAFSLQACEVLPPTAIRQQDFQYGPVSGMAELVGFQIILFRSAGTTHNTCLSIDWGENQNATILEIGQAILRQLGAKVFLCDPLAAVKAVYGKAQATRTLYDQTRTHYYWDHSKKMLHAFTVDHARGVTSMELIHEAAVVQDRLEWLGFG